MITQGGGAAGAFVVLGIAGSAASAERFGRPRRDRHQSRRGLGAARRSGGHAGATRSLPSSGDRATTRSARRPPRSRRLPRAAINRSDETGNRSSIEQSGKDDVVAVRRYGTRNVASVVQSGSAVRFDAVRGDTANVRHVTLTVPDNALGLV